MTWAKTPYAGFPAFIHRECQNAIQLLHSFYILTYQDIEIYFRNKNNLYVCAYITHSGLSGLPKVSEWAIWPDNGAVISFLSSLQPDVL